MKLQLRANGFNFLNHPLWSFNGGSALNLTYSSAGVLNNPLLRDRDYQTGSPHCAVDGPIYVLKG